MHRFSARQILLIAGKIIKYFKLEFNVGLVFKQFAPAANMKGLAVNLYLRYVPDLLSPND